MKQLTYWCNPKFKKTNEVINLGAEFKVLEWRNSAAYFYRRNSAGDIKYTTVPASNRGQIGVESGKEWTLYGKKCVSLVCGRNCG